MDKTLVKTVCLSVGLMLLTLWLYPYYQDELRGNFAEWHVINANVGGKRGDANLIVIGDKVVMIDAGNNYDKVSNVAYYLQRFEVDTIHHFFISHPHTGFFSGLIPILNAGITIEKIYAQAAPVKAMASYREQVYFTQTLQYAISLGSEVVEVDKGFTVSLPNQAKLEVIHVWNGDGPVQNRELDETSMAIRLEVAESSVLFAGDIEGEPAQQFAAMDDLHADILKVPHPGKDDKSLLTVLEAVKPKNAIVPAPKRRWCAEPGEAARKWIEGEQIPSWVTGLHGNIRVVWRPNQLLIVPQYANRMCQE